MQICLEDRFDRPVESFKNGGVSYIGTHNLLEHNYEDDNYVLFRVTAVPGSLPPVGGETKKSERNSNSIMINRELWLMFYPKYHNKPPEQQQHNTLITFQVEFLPPASPKSAAQQPIIVYLIFPIHNYRTKLLVHITNSPEYCYIRSNNSFIVSRTSKAISPDSLTEIYTHYSMVYTARECSISNYEFFCGIISPQVHDNSNEIALALSLYPQIAASQIHSYKFKKEILSAIWSKQQQVSYPSDCLMDALLDRLKESGLLQIIKTENSHKGGESDQQEDYQEEQLPPPKRKSIIHRLKPLDITPPVQQAVAAHTPPGQHLKETVETLLKKMFTKQTPKEETVSTGASSQHAFSGEPKNDDEVEFSFKLKPKKSIKKAKRSSSPFSPPLISSRRKATR